MVCGMGLVLLMATGCHTLRQPVSPQATTTVERKAPVYRKAPFTCTIKNAVIPGQVRMQEDSIIWASAVKLIELGRVRLTHDSVTVYAQVTGQYFRGTYEDVYLQTGVKTSFEEVQSVLTSGDSSAITAFAAKFRMPLQVSLGPWDTPAELTFPLAIPQQARPFEVRQKQKNERQP